MGYLIDKTQDVWKVVFSGTLNQEILRELMADSDSTSSPNRIFDLRKVDNLDVSSSEIMHYASIRKHTHLSANVKWAYITSHPLHYGFARMVQNILEGSQNEIRIFADESEAMEWIGSSR